MLCKYCSPADYYPGYLGVDFSRIGELCVVLYHVLILQSITVVHSKLVRLQNQ